MVWTLFFNVHDELVDLMLLEGNFIFIMKSKRLVEMVVLR